MKIRHEINIPTWDIAVNDGGRYIVQLDTTKYSGTCTYYFEVRPPGTNSDSVSLRRVGTTTDDVTIVMNTGCDYTLCRSASFTPPTGATEYFVHTPSWTMYQAKIIIIQDTGSSNLTACEGQFEIGGRSYADTFNNTTAEVTTAPKYWKYEADAWDGTVTFYAEAVYDVTNASYGATIILQESTTFDNGQNTWSDKVTIVSGGVSTTPVRIRSSSFTPVDGRFYRYVAYISDSAGSYRVHNVKIIVQQTGTNITKLQTHYLFNIRLFDENTNEQDRMNRWDPDEWDGVNNLYRFAIDTIGTNYPPVVTHLVKKSTSSTIDNSITDHTLQFAHIGGYDTRMMNADLWGNHALNSGGNTAVGASFTSHGGTLDYARFILTKSGSPTGNAVAKIYAHTGTFGSTGTPTGSALATSDNFDVSTVTTSNALYTFTFSGANQISLVDGTNYFIVIEYSGGDISNQLKVMQEWNPDHHPGNNAVYNGSWSTEGNTLAHAVYTDPEISLVMPETVEILDTQMTSNPTTRIHGYKIIVNVVKEAAVALGRSWGFIMG